jgi:outer membrane receptor protein involved in Fe transport
VNLDTENYGLEVSGTWLVSDNLRAIVSYSHIETDITNDAFFRDTLYGERTPDNEVIPENVKGNELMLTPKDKVALSLHYFWPTSMGEFTFGGTGLYMGERYFDLGNHDSADSYGRLDIQASWTSPEGRYKILGLVNNATDEEAFNTHNCSVNASAVPDTPSWIPTCSGNPRDQRLWEMQFMVKI